MYLDSAILLKLVVREPDSLYYASQLDGATGVWTCDLALTECWSALLRKEREEAIDADTRAAAWQRLERYVASGVSLLPVDAGLQSRARKVMERCHPEVAIRSLDALHLAACEALAAFPLWTNDTRMRAAAALLRTPLAPLPPDAAPTQ